MTRSTPGPSHPSKELSVLNSIMQLAALGKGSDEGCLFGHLYVELCATVSAQRGSRLDEASQDIAFTCTMIIIPLDEAEVNVNTSGGCYVLVTEDDGRGGRGGWEGIAVGCPRAEGAHNAAGATTVQGNQRRKALHSYLAWMCKGCKFSMSSSSSQGGQ